MNSDNESPEKKKPKSSQSPEIEDLENKKKVADFVLNLEKKNGSKKFTQTKIKLAALKDANK